jgi:GT2 family glycosyltransferase
MELAHPSTGLEPSVCHDVPAEHRLQFRASVCIPTRNRADLLRLTLESLDRQCVDPDRFQVVVADDGSRDGTIDLLRRLRANYELKWTRLTGRGSGAARNAAARAADHEVLIFLDDDQITSPSLVHAHLETQERDGVVIVQGDYPLAAGWDRDGASLLFERSRRFAFARVETPASLAFHLWGGNFSVRRETWRQIGGFDEDLPRSQDLDFGLRAADLGVPTVLELRARSHHLHRVSVDMFRQQHFSEGRCLVKISRKRGVPVEPLLGSPVNRRVDRILTLVWVRYPRWAATAGRGFSAILWASDRLRVRPLQLFSARVLRRFHELGGMALESVGGMPAAVPANERAALIIAQLRPRFPLD